MAHISGHAAAKYRQVVQSVDASTAFNVGSDFGGQGAMPVGNKLFTELANADTIMVRATSLTNPRHWEVGLYTYTSASKTLTRTTILESSNSNNAVNFAATGVAGSVQLEALAFVASTANVFTITGFAADRTYNAGSAAVAETNQVLASLIQDLAAAGIVKAAIS